MDSINFFKQQLDGATLNSQGGEKPILMGGKNRSIHSIVEEFQKIMNTTSQVDMRTVVHIINQIQRLDPTISAVSLQRFNPEKKAQFQKELEREKSALHDLEKRYQKLTMSLEEKNLSELSAEDDEIIALLNDASILLESGMIQKFKDSLQNIRGSLKIMHSHLEKQERGQIAGKAAPQLQMSQLLEGVPDDMVEGVKKLLEKHFRISYESHFYTVEDYRLIQELGNVNDQLDPLLDEIIGKISTSFDQKWEALEQCAEKIMQEGVNEEFLFHDLYWELHDPLDTGLDPYQMKKFAQEFETEWPDNFSPLLKEAEKIGNKPPTQELLQHKIEWLRGKKQSRREALENKIPNALIIGGAPGGLATALVADALGCNWEVVEARSQYTRWNVVTLTNFEANQFLKYFGVFDRLVLEHRVENRQILDVPIKNLETAMKQTLEELRVKEEGRVTTGTFVGIQQGEGSVQAVVKEGKEATVRQNPDFLIGLDGARSTTAAVLGISKEAYSQETTNLAVLLKRGEETKYDLMRMNEEIDQDWEVVHSHPVHITVTKAERSTALIQNTLCMIRGDAYATPDPTTGLGCANAIAGAFIWGKSVQEKIAGKPLDSIRSEAEMSVDLFYREMVQRSLDSRQLFNRKNTADYTSACGVNYLLMNGAFTAAQAKQLKIAIEKQEKGLPLTDEDRALAREQLPLVPEKTRLYTTLLTVMKQMSSFT